MKNLVIIGTVFPEPNSTAAGERMLQLIDFFQSENYAITFLSSAHFSENSFPLNSLNITTHLIKLNDASFDDLLKKINPEMVLFDRFLTEEQFGWRVSEVCPNALKILDTEDLHFLRKARENAYKQNQSLDDISLISDVFKREIASILRCDLSLIISQYEIELLKNEYKINENLLMYLPLFAEIKPQKNDFHERKNFVSIGNFLHEPNWQTVLILKQRWKKIKKQLPDAKILIYGAYITEKAKQLHHEKEGFIVKGKAESVEMVYNKARVLLAPIPFGAGIKGKLLKSMELGLPNVTSSMGAEAMHGNFPWNGFISDNETEFIENSVTLYQNEEIWNKSQQNGYEIIKNRFEKKLFLSQFSEKISQLQSHLQEHRNENFLGQILQHHTLQSTKYMSKWIEEKNKK